MSVSIYLSIYLSIKTMIKKMINKEAKSSLILWSYQPINSGHFHSNKSTVERIWN